MAGLFKQLFSLILPVTALVIVPLLIEKNLLLVFDMLFAFGMILMIGGLMILIFTISLFIRIGRGTLAPWSPTENLVTKSVYAYVRNPMITGVFIALIGESLILHSVNIFVWSLLFFAINSIYFRMFEEPGLEKRFGKEYLEYKRNVPRWIPRLQPWSPSEKIDQDSKSIQSTKTNHQF